MCLEHSVHACASPRHCSFPPPCSGVSIPGQHPCAGPNPAHTSPATALTGEDEEPERCLQRGAQHGGLRGSVAKSCQEQSRMSAALLAEEGCLSHLGQGGPRTPTRALGSLLHLRNLPSLSSFQPFPPGGVVGSPSHCICRKSCF